MLADFFKLNAGYRTFTNQRQLVAHLGISNNLKNTLYRPNNWPSTLAGVKRITFENVSLSKTTFKQITFTSCTFIDCLFINCEFLEVDFHGCAFINCNFYKSEFKNCYLDPKSINLHKSYQKTHANVGVILFQRLFADAMSNGQADHARNSDIAFRRWQRAQLDYYLEKDRISKLDYRIAKLKSVVSDWLSSFGYSPMKFFVWTIFAFTAVSMLNFSFLSDSIVVQGSTGPVSFVDTVFYTYSVLTVLGFSMVTPITPVAKLVTVAQALCAIGWLGIFTSILVKRFLR